MHFTLKGKVSLAHPYQLDKTLTVPGAGAEAEAVGQAIEAVRKIADDHAKDNGNPHNVTKEQVGLGNVDNTSDMDKPVSTLQAEAIKDAKKAGTDAQTAAEAAQQAAEQAQAAAEQALTDSKTYADTVAGTALTDSKTYTEEYVKGKHLSLTAAITTDWTRETAPYTQVVNVVGILEDDRPHVMPVYSEDLETALEQKEAWAMVSDAKTAEGSITFICFENKPAVSIDVQIEVNR